MASPDASSNRESYLYEIGKFKDLVRDCNQNNENDHLITVAEGIECLSKFVREPFFLSLVEDKATNFVATFSFFERYFVMKTE